MNDIVTKTIDNTSISLNEPIIEQKSGNNRREESKKRAEEFRKQLQQINTGNNEAPKTEVPVPSLITSDSDVRNDEMNEQTENPNQMNENDDETEDSIIPKKRFNKEIEKRKLLEEELKRERESRIKYEEKRKLLEEELKRERESCIKYETELNMFTKAIESMNKTSQNQIQEQFDPIDSDAHNLYMHKIQELEQKYQSQTNNLNEFQQKQHFAQTIDRQAAEFSQKNPDFNDAYNYLLGIETTKAKMMGYDDSQASQIALESLQPMAWKAYQSGNNVAEIAYNMAKNYGYKSVSTKNTSTNNSPNFDKIDKNMAKSYTILDEIPGVSTSVSPEHAAYLSMSSRDRLANKNGRGTNLDSFKKALEAVKQSASTRQ